MVLNRNPGNYFAEIEQASFEPDNMVRGIGPSPDKMVLGRLFSYPDTHRHRIGTNYLELPVNRPLSPGVLAPQAAFSQQISKFSPFRSIVRTVLSPEGNA